jgi:hypothetical protein
MTVMSKKLVNRKIFPHCASYNVFGSRITERGNGSYFIW